MKTSELRIDQIGQCSVDSGQILFVDPCYIDSEWQSTSYDEICAVTLSDAGAGTVVNGLAVATSTAYGDGVYPVYAQRDESGRILAVMIVFEDEMEAM